MIELAPVTLGPVVLAGDRALVVVSLLVGLIVAEVVSRRSGRDAEWAWSAVIVGLLAARLGFVVVNADVFLARPLEIVFFWQGGFLAWLGVMVGAGWAGWTLRRQGGDVRPLVAPSVAALLAAVVALAVLPVAPDRPSLATVSVPLVSMAGEPVVMADWWGTPTVVNLWATWCGPCRRELPMLIDEVSGREDVRLVLASQAEAASTVQAYMQEQGLPLDDVVLDGGGGLQRVAQAVGLPTTLFVDAEGNVVQVAFGELGRATVRDGIVAAQRGVEGDGP